jgi:hypothetical protein
MKLRRAFHCGKVPLAQIVLVFVLSTVALGATVRGRLDRVYPNGARYPATGVAVTLFNQSLGRTTPAYAGPDGLYYFYNIRPGSYYLEVWTSQNGPPAVYPINVVEPYTDIGPVIVP